MCMESLYKNALQEIRHPSSKITWFYPLDWSYTKSIEETDREPKKAAINERSSQVTEKTMMLDKLYQFGQEKLAEDDKVRFDGGEILRKENVSQKTISLDAPKVEFDQLLSQFQNFELNSQAVAVFNKKLKLKSDLKILFVTDDIELQGETEIIPGFEDLSLFFKPDVARLFHKMIMAMNLRDDQYAISSVQLNGKSKRAQLVQEIDSLSPQMIMTLGASAASELLNTNERLKDIHGKFYTIELNHDSERSIELVPIFSPKLLQTAPNMKKTAWRDMQKVIESLNLIK